MEYEKEKNWIDFLCQPDILRKNRFKKLDWKDGQ